MVIAALLHPKVLISFPRIPFSETIELRTRGFFRVRKNSCRMCHLAKCRKALWLQARGALWSNCKRSQSSGSIVLLCKKYQLKHTNIKMNQFELFCSGKSSFLCISLISDTSFLYTANGQLKFGPRIDRSTFWIPSPRPASLLQCSSTNVIRYGISPIPGIHLRRFSKDEGRFRSARNLNRSSSLSRSDSCKDEQCEQGTFSPQRTFRSSAETIFARHSWP